MEAVRLRDSDKKVLLYVYDNAKTPEEMYRLLLPYFKGAWGLCQDIAMLFVNKFNAKAITGIGSFRGRLGRGNHVVAVIGDKVYDVINEFEGKLEDWKNKFGIEDTKDFTQNYKVGDIHAYLGSR